MTREEIKKLIHHIEYNLEIGKEVTLTDDDCKEIIKALEKEPCEDAISRQAAIDVLNDGAELLRRVLDDIDVVGTERAKLKWGLGIIESYICDMKELPSTEPKTSWIPVGERLPKKDRYTDFYKCLVAVCCTSRNTICDSFTAYFDGKHFYRNRYDRAIISEVKAWMPLPNPYEPQKSEDKG